MQQVVLKHCAIVITQWKESGTIQTDTETDQNLDIWIECENELLHEQEEAKKPKKKIAKERCAGYNAP